MYKSVKNKKENSQEIPEEQDSRYTQAHINSRVLRRKIAFVIN
jgi:hypothetical protein